MNSREKIRNLKREKIQGTVLKGAFVTSEVSNKQIFLYKNTSVSDKELRLQLSGLIKPCAETLVFLGMTNMERNNIKRHYLSDILQSKLL